MCMFINEVILLYLIARYLKSKSKNILYIEYFDSIYKYKTLIDIEIILRWWKWSSEFNRASLGKYITSQSVLCKLS